MQQYRSTHGRYISVLWHRRLNETNVNIYWDAYHMQVDNNVQSQYPIIFTSAAVHHWV